MNTVIWHLWVRDDELKFQQVSISPYIVDWQQLISELNICKKKKKISLPAQVWLHFDQRLFCMLLPVKPFIPNGVFLHFFPSHKFFVQLFCTVNLEAWTFSGM